MSNIFKSSQLRFVEATKVIQKDCEVQEEIDLNEIIAEAEAKAELKAEEIITNANIKADNIVLKARDDAERVLEKTHTEAKEIYNISKLDGYNIGYEKGYSEGKKVSDTLIEEANIIKKDYLNEREKVLSSIEKDVIQMIISLCEKIINEKLDNDKEAILPIILGGINSLNVKESLMIKVSKEDYEVVNMSKQRILAMANLVEDIDIRIDSTLNKGGCIIEGSKGNVDVSIDLQIEEMKKLLNTLLNSE